MLSLSSCKYTLYNCFRIGSVSYLPPILKFLPPTVTFMDILLIALVILWYFACLYTQLRFYFLFRAASLKLFGGKLPEDYY